MKNKKGLIFLVVSIIIIATFVVFTILTPGKVDVETYKPSVYSTIGALLPPVIAIILALITKEVYSSLFLGLVSGALIYCKFNTIDTLENVFEKGILPGLGGSSNLGILTFLVTLGILVVLLGKSGGTAAYGRWAGKHIHSKRVAMLSTFGLGVLLSVDDYFNAYDDVKNIASEAKEKLKTVNPTSIGQASRISGVSPADINVLLVFLEELRK